MPFPGRVRPDEGVHVAGQAMTFARRSGEFPPRNLTHGPAPPQVHGPLCAEWSQRRHPSAPHLPEQPAACDSR